MDVLINNAGTVFGETLLDLSDTAIETTYKVNILSHYWVSVIIIFLLFECEINNYRYKCHLFRNLIHNQL